MVSLTLIHSIDIMGFPSIQLQIGMKHRWFRHPFWLDNNLNIPKPCSIWRKFFYQPLHCLHAVAGVGTLYCEWGKQVFIMSSESDLFWRLEPKMRFFNCFLWSYCIWLIVLNSSILCQWTLPLSLCKFLNDDFFFDLKNINYDWDVHNLCIITLLLGPFNLTNVAF